MISTLALKSQKAKEQNPRNITLLFFFFFFDGEEMGTRRQPLLLVVFCLALSFSRVEAFETDMQALLAFREAADAGGKLGSWNSTDGGPCFGKWVGVSCNQNRVSRVVLENMSLFGSGLYILTTSLDQLRVLSLKNNYLSGEIPDLSGHTALKLLFLSHNNFSGKIPTSIGSLTRLYRLDLSSNNLSGPFPTAELNQLGHLLTLRLDQNKITGPISSIRLTILQDFNVSSNLLTGAIPPSLAVFPASVFRGNNGLCGPPVSSSCGSIVSDPSRPGSEADGPSPQLIPTSPAATAVISSSPGTKPPEFTSASVTSPDATPTTVPHKERGMTRVAVIAIVVGDFLVLVLVTCLLFWYFWKKHSGHRRSRLQEGEKIVYSSSPYTSTGGNVTAGVGTTSVIGYERGKMVFFEGTKRFELEDLLRASAEMLGKGGYGTAYKAVLEDGNVVAVKRLRDGGTGTAGGVGVGKREFEVQMDLIGRLRHPNLVSLKAFYYARDEKLLVYEYMPNGSLFSLLHGNRGPGRTPLDWTTRLRIAAGVARGLTFLHHNHRKLSHGNIKSTNVLIDKSGTARVTDFGLSLLLGGHHSLLRPNGYRAPESKPSHKSDVYSFGVLLLEILTGKYPSQLPDGGVGGGVGGSGIVDLPRWVQSVVREEWTAEVFDLELMRYKDIEEEMVGLLQIGMACTSISPDQRPSMSHVLKMIEEIRGADVSPSHESFDSVSDSPTVSEDTTNATR